LAELNSQTWLLILGLIPNFGFWRPKERGAKVLTRLTKIIGIIPWVIKVGASKIILTPGRG